MKNFALVLMFAILSFSLMGCETKNSNENVDNQKETINFNTKNMKTDVKVGDTIAVLDTSMGELKMLLYTEKAPKTTENFIELAKQGKYTNVPFHRIIKDFMIQGGDFENMNGTGGYSFKGEGTLLDDEIVPELKHIYGAVSMAKTAAPNTAGSQFFIVQNHNGTPHLDGVHSVFGYVYEGMDVVEKMATVEKGPMDNPIEPILLKSVTIETVK